MEGFLKVSSQLPFNYNNARKYTSEIQFTSFLISIGYIVVIFGIKHVCFLKQFLFLL